MAIAEARPQYNFAESATVRSGQVATAELQFYGKLLRTFDAAAKTYADRIAESGKLSEDKNDVRDRTRLALEDLYFGRNNPRFMHQFQRDWGQEAEPLLAQVKRITPEIKQTENDTLSRSGEITTREKLTTTFNMGMKLASRNITPDQKKHMLTLAGYTPDEAEKIKNKIRWSLGLTGFGTAAQAGTISLSAGAGAYLSFLDHADPNTNLALALSFAGHYTMFGLNTRQSVRLTENPDYGTSINTVATAIYYILDKTMPEKTISRETINVIGAMVPFLGVEIFVNTFLGTTDQPSAIVAKNVAMAGLNIAEASIVELLLRRRKK